MAAHKNYLGQLAGQAQPGNHDTVGAVVVDNQGHMASAVSSGGLILKRPGRVGDVSQNVSLLLLCQADLNTR